MYLNFLSKVILTIFLSLGVGCNSYVEKNNEADKTQAVKSQILPSWKDNATKQRIISFVQDVTNENSKNFIAQQDRIAVFDNDGTMWCEKPLPFQLLFVFDRIKELAPQHPEWKKKQPFKAVLENDFATIKKTSWEDFLKLFSEVTLNRSAEEFKSDVLRWLNTAKHPKFKTSYIDLVYKPMLELINYLRANEFKVFIVSGGGIDFMRAFIPKKYGVPSWQILGSYGKTKFKNGKIVKLPEVVFINNAENKPVAIYRKIGKQPVFACGNSDGDLQMLQYSASGKLPSLQVYIHHTDNQREYEYGSEKGGFSIVKGLAYAKDNNWLIVDMKRDWKVIFDAKTLNRK